MPSNDRETSRLMQEHRTAEAVLTVTDSAGRPVAGSPVTVRMTRHRFLFGCNIYMLFSCRGEQLEQAYQQRFADLLNYATLPFYWGSYERTPGQPQEQRLRRMAEWCAERGIRTKGHPLCWHEVVPGWLNEMPDDEVERLQQDRITREVGGFAGLIDTWDVINETCVMPVFPRGPNAVTRLCNRLGAVALVKRVFEGARQANPRATLVLNDFDTSEKYENLIERCLEASVPFDVIGIQSHMHKGYWGAERTAEVCRRFARFGKPLHFTETTILSGALKTDDDWHGDHPGWATTPGGEQRQAEQVEEFYRVLLGHPSVEAVTWWDFSDHGAWQGAPAGFLRADMSPKPAYEALSNLIRKECWTGPLDLTTDARGQVRFRGYLGVYEARSQTRAGRFELTCPGAAEVTLCPGEA